MPITYNLSPETVELLQEILNQELNQTTATRLFYEHQTSLPLAVRVADPNVDLDTDLVRLKMYEAKIKRALTEIL